jgi:peptidoglycan/xylan/chitin deacetylase (PgdA/CDA1 family)/glycosyltransferase involved in cell wall biosynthesis
MQPTGAEAYALTLADWQTDYGCDVTIISDRIHHKTRQPYIPLSVHSNSAPTRIKSTLFLRKFLKEKNIQVIHCHSRAAARLAYWATRGLKVAVVSTIHGRQPTSLSKKLLDIYGEKIVCICENVQAQLTQNLKMNPRKMRLIRNPVKTSDLRFVETITEKSKIAWIGRFTGPKGDRARQFIEHAVPVLLERFPNLEIEIVGGNPQLLGDRIQDLIQALQKRHSQRLLVHSHLEDFNRDLANYRLIMGAGRVAISSLMRGIPTYAIGEYSSKSLVTPQNIAKAMTSNFGDIGADGKATSEIDLNLMTKEFIEILSRSEVLSLEERQQLREAVFKNFDLEKVCRRVHNIYKSAYFLKNHARPIPVLMYHKIPHEDLQSKHRIFVNKNNFEKHLQFYQSRGFTTVTFKELEEFRSGRKSFSEFPTKPLLITFDDGYVDNLENAAPLLKKYNMKAVIYLLADHSIKENYWDNDGEEPIQPLMSLEQKQKLLDYGYEIGSHGFSHRKITEMSETEAFHELNKSKEQLEKDLGLPISSFAYTYGVTSPLAEELAEDAGYSFAVNTTSGGLTLEENPYSIFRINIFPEDGPAQLRKKTSSWYRRYFHLKRGR